MGAAPAGRLNNNAAVAALQGFAFCGQSRNNLRFTTAIVQRGPIRRTHRYIHSDRLYQRFKPGPGSTEPMATFMGSPNTRQ